MPLMKGGDLASAMPKLSAVARVRVMRDALRGLQALHTCNILHFDVSYTTFWILAHSLLCSGKT